MKIPSRQQAQAYIEEAERINPGPWVQHSIEVAKAAESIADHHPQLETESAFILGRVSVRGRNRSPRPAARIMAFMENKILERYYR